MTTTANRPPETAEIIAAEAAVMQRAMPTIAALKAGTLALELKQLPMPTSHADRIAEICDCREPDMDELRQGFAGTVPRADRSQGPATQRNARQTVGSYADRCLDAAMACARAIGRHDGRPSRNAPGKLETDAGRGSCQPSRPALTGRAKPRSEKSSSQVPATLSGSAPGGIIR